MLKAIVKILAVFIAATLSFIIGKFIFIACNHSAYSMMGMSDMTSVLSHGLSMDFSIAGYISILPALLISSSCFYGSKGLINRILKIYFIVISLLISLIIILDSVLYGYWQFKLDSTPLFYFFSSPASAFASAEWWQLAVSPVIWILLASIFYSLLYFGSIKLPGDMLPMKGKKHAAALSASILFTALLFIPIRGGVTVSTMNLSRAYFSENPRLNHAAVNPAFSLMYSLSHQNNFSDQFRFLRDDEVKRLFDELKDAPEANASDSLVAISRPDIYIVLLESFSSHLFPSLGGEPIATKLDSIASKGLLFTRFYANSFRTDRGIPAVISAYPGQPHTSIMKFVEKTENLPSLSKQLKTEAGYNTTYYYGGDANFSNMKAYLVSAGFDRIVSDEDFPVSQKLSKWGAHDDVLFKKVADELTDYDPSKPILKVVQTSSSHEPFKVPYDDNGRLADQRAKAFAFADSCAADFINSLHKSGQWDKSLIILVPDHYGAYPDLTDPLKRHMIPLIMTGGALTRHGRIDTVGSQIDIAATLLSSLGLDHKDFPFSKNVLNPSSPHFAFFADPSVIGFVKENDEVVFNLDSSQTEFGNDSILPYAKAFLQTLYDDLSKR